MSNMSSYTLRECPFCGGEAELATKGMMMQVRCMACGASTDWQRRPDRRGPLTAEDIAVGSWNSRVPASPSAAPEQTELWEPVTENSIACACGDRECSTSLEFWEGNNIALCYMGKSDYDGGEVRRVTGDIVLPADVCVCRRVGDAGE